MSRKPISRRDFLKAAGLSAGATTVACCGLSYAAADRTEAPAVAVDTPSYAYGKEGSMNPRILVAYATRTGSTVGVAAAIAEKLSAKGAQVDVRPMNESPSPEGYSAVVLGSAVNGAQWLPEAVQFVKDNQAAINQIPAALFCVHIMNLGDDEKSRSKRLAYLNAVRVLIQPVEEAYFAGMGMILEEASRFERWMYRAFKVGPEGDCRDWEKIQAWSGELRPKLGV
jgi:menaquinone-dependent protoporphyrinogen oxidase